LDILIQINKLTHKLLSKDLILDDFDALLKEADQSVTSSYGRIAVHILYEITSDVLPNYCYNHSTMRFVATKLRLIKAKKRDEPPTYLVQDLWGSKAMQTAFQAICSMYTQFIGFQHFKYMTKYLGYQGIALIMNEFFKFIESSVC
jgi:cytoplasmic FMR1 interacting protein